MKKRREPSKRRKRGSQWLPVNEYGVVLGINKPTYEKRIGTEERVNGCEKPGMVLLAQ